MSRHHWFLPDLPDILALLRRQLAITARGMDAFAAWAAAGGDPQAAATVRALEHDADDRLGLTDRVLGVVENPVDPARQRVQVLRIQRGDERRAQAVAQLVLGGDGVARLAERSGDATEPADAA